MTLTMPVITTMCAESCPKAGAVFCNYDFLDKMSAADGKKWSTNPLSDTEKSKSSELSYNGFEADFGCKPGFRIFNPMAELQVTQACLAAQSKPNGYTGSAFEFCQDVFYQV